MQIYSALEAQQSEGKLKEPSIYLKTKSKQRKIFHGFKSSFLLLKDLIYVV